MLMLNARFTALAIFCNLATQSVSPGGGAGVQAAVIARHPPSGGYDTQARFSMPWTSGKAKDASSSVQNKVRSIDFMPSSPLQFLIDATILHFQRSAGHRKRRSHKSIVIPNNHGGKYSVGNHHAKRASTPQWVAAPAAQNGTFFNGTSASAQSTSTQGTPGTVGIMSHSDTSSDKLLASLFLVDMNGTFVLDASDQNSTQLFMINAPTTSSSSPVATSANGTVPVKLCMPFSDGEQYCATYDPNPPAPEPLTMQPDMAATNAGQEHQSQIFMYDGQSGVIRPTWFADENDGKSETAADYDDQEAEDVGTSSTSTDSVYYSPVSSSAASTSASTYPSGPASMGAAGGADWRAAATSASWSAMATSESSMGWGERRDVSSSSAPDARNVTLVFIPNKRTANNAAAAAVDNGAFSSASTSASTVTTTVTVYGSSVPASSGFAAAAATTSSAPVASASATGLGVELVGSGFPPKYSVSSSSSAPASSFTVASATDSISSAMSYSSSAPTITASASGFDVAAIAASIISARLSASASASSASAAARSSSSAQSSSAFAVASAAASESLSSYSASSSSVPSFVAAVLERAAAPEVTPVSTDPYFWRFKAETR